MMYIQRSKVIHFLKYKVDVHCLIYLTQDSELINISQVIFISSVKQRWKIDMKTPIYVFCIMQ